jgi:hypothetical protein
MMVGFGDFQRGMAPQICARSSQLSVYLPKRLSPLEKKAAYGAVRRQCPCEGLGVLLQFSITVYIPYSHKQLHYNISCANYDILCNTKLFSI